MRRRCHLLWLLGVLLLAAVCAFAQSDERITSFDSAITVDANAPMQVRETIAVIATGNAIKHGIYRDFPTIYRGKWGEVTRVGFTVLSVQRDGQAEPYYLEKRQNGVRMYIGFVYRFVDPGPHTYIITYTTDHQLGFFANHDELYWNVTGNGWSFPIDKASATVILPATIPRKAITTSGYTGPSGSKAHDLQSWVDRAGLVHFATTKPLAVHEGLTIVTTFPKGYIQAPFNQASTADWVAGNQTWVNALGCLAILAFYYLFVLAAVGRDPKKGTIIPLYTPPQDLSPAAVRFIWKMLLDDKALTAAIINLGVKGLAKISESGAGYELSRVTTPQNPSPGVDNQPSPEESALLDTLLQTNSITLSNQNYQTFQAARREVKKSLTSRYGTGELFRRNTAYKVVGFFISLAFAGFVLMSVLKPDAIEPFVLFNLTTQGDPTILYLMGTAFTLIGGLLFFGAVVPLLFTIWNNKQSPLLGNRSMQLTGMMILIFFGLIFFSVGSFVTLGCSTTYYLYLFGMILLHAVFWHTLSAYTVNGRLLMDQIEGLRLYLSVAEAGQLPSPNPREQASETFERLLPYALALDVEEQWADQFAGIAALAIDGQRDHHPYSPDWYSGPAWRGDNPGSFAGALGSAFASAITSSATSPGTSSGGGGGGGAGGGGGGGGGGGW